MNDYTLYNYFRSSTSTRVRAALNLKGIDYDYEPVQLRDGEQHSDAFLTINPQGLVPSLRLPDESVLSQSVAIIEYLDEVHPDPPLLPADAIGRARVRSLALHIACEIHPLNNLRVLKTLRGEFGADHEAITAWFRKWAIIGFASLESRLANEPQTGRFCHGDAPGLADICLVAQVLRNEDFEVDMTPYPTLARIFVECMRLDAFKKAVPSEQPDAD